MSANGKTRAGPAATEDDLPHKPNGRPDWRESYYFNFVDIEAGVSGFSTIGIVPNLRKREFVFVLFHDGKRTAYFMENEGELSGDLCQLLSDGKLSYEMVEPLWEWRMTFAGDDLKADIRWRGRFPVYCFGGCSKTSWSDHFEQSGTVTGTVNLPGGRRVSLNGLGQRDKSWGPRDWHIESWYALHAQFDDLSIGLRRDVIKGTAITSGVIATQRGHVPIARVDLETGFMDGTNVPCSATTKVHGEDGSVYTIRSRLITPTSYIRFARSFPSGTTELYEEMAVHECDELGKGATGLIEWLYTRPKCV